MGLFLHKLIFKIFVVVGFGISTEVVFGQIVLFSEDFTEVKKGNTSTLSGSKTKWHGNNQIISVDYVYQAGEAIKLGVASKAGSITTVPIDLSVNNGMFTLQFDVKGWLAVEGDIEVNIDNLQKQIVSYKSKMEDDFETKELYFIGGKPNSKITIATTAKRAFIDNIIVYCTETIQESIDFQIKNDETVSVWNGVSWSNKVGPDITLNVIIDGDCNTSSESIIAQNLVVKSGTLTIASGTSVIIKEGIQVKKDGGIRIQNNANVLQIEERDNSGECVVEIDSEPLVRFDYSGWSSPVENQKIFDFSPKTCKTGFQVFNTVLRVKELVEIETDFEPARGYLIQAPAFWPRKVASPYSGCFIGILRNGRQTINLKQEINSNSGYNLIGNPYPSAISADAFIEANTKKIDGTLYFWMPNHSMNNDRSYKASNYAKYTRAGGTSTKAGGIPPSGIIRTGQTFFVNALMINSEIIFTNKMRLSNYKNPFFVAVEDILTVAKKIEKHRFWLNLTNEEGVFSQILIAYMPEATNGIDQGIDAKDFGDAESSIYTIIDNEAYAIQGRPLPFDISDTLALGFKTLKKNTFFISLEKTEGLFSDNEPIYIKDNYTNILYDLKEKAYQFSSEKGIFNNRFEILYDKSVVREYLIDEDIVIYNENKSLHIVSKKSIIQKIAVFDITGRLLRKQRNVNRNTVVIINDFAISNQILILNISTQMYGMVTKKIVY